MTQPFPRQLVGVAVSVVLVAGLFALLVFLVRGQQGLGYEPAADRATTSASITLGAFPDSMACHGAGGGPHSTWVTYCPSTTIKLPAHSIVTVTIDQYDSAMTFHSPFFAKVRGTIGNTMTVNGRPMTQVDLDAAGHAFTIQTPPDANEDQLFVAAAAVPNVGLSMFLAFAQQVCTATTPSWPTGPAASPLSSISNSAPASCGRRATCRLRSPSRGWPTAG